MKKQKFLTFFFTPLPATNLPFFLSFFCSPQIFVFFPDEEKVGVKTIKEYAKRMKDESVYRAIIVVQASLTPFAKQSLLECQAQKFYIEQFQETELLAGEGERGPGSVVNSPAHTLIARLNTIDS